MICALLIFQTPELPDSLPSISPWLDWLITPRADVYAQLAAQQHRRFIKSHTPLDGVVWHLTCAWQRRDQRAVVLVHYDDLVMDLDREMRRLAFRLGITVPTDEWPALVHAAGFAQMRSRAGSLVPDPAGVFRDRMAFFRRGSSGAGSETLTREELEAYHVRVSQMAPRDLLEWLHRDSSPALGTR
jgi:hypothetical protein